ncbi:MAG: putative metal-binding motif-containing protein [Candidatus Nanoarchaeia archaeon]|nr:putative metal-binding motif-containing protein [Candidatus Nanoarchaeia archaeon]
MNFEKKKEVALILGILALFIIQSLGLVSAASTDKDFNVPIYIKTTAGIERATSDQLSEILFNHGFEIEKKLETVSMKDCSIRAKSGTSTVNGLLNYANNNQLSFYVTYWVDGNGELVITDSKYNRFSLKFKPTKIITTNSQELVFEASTSAKLNKKSIDVGTITVRFDKTTKKVSIDGGSFFSVNNMAVTLKEGCMSEKIDTYIITGRGILDEPRNVKEVKSILKNHPEFIDAYEGLKWATIGVSGTVIYDQDGDGFDYTKDCNDNNADIFPGATEIPYDGIDQDCSGKDLTDVDGDGFDAVIVGGLDCDDNNFNVNPSITESCNGIDDNCNGIIDEEDSTGCVVYYYDGDADLYGISDNKCLCAPFEKYNTLVDSDCNDEDSTIYPGATEVPYDSVDQDCSGADLTDVDADGFDAVIVGGTDCDDNNFNVNPSIVESCNTIDDDCDALTDEEDSIGCGIYYLDNDADTYGIDDSKCLCSGTDKYTSSVNTDCDDTNIEVNPGETEIIYNGINDDCNAETLDDDLDQDGFVLANDCDDNNANVNPDMIESCNNVDDNCDGTIDEGVKTVFYQDADADTYGNPSSTQLECVMPAGYVTNSLDCDDTNANINPVASEVCNGADDDCDDSVDEDLVADLATNQNGICAESLKVCNGASGWIEPNYTIITGYEILDSSCNNIDNNCDGFVDESYVATETTCGVGICASAGLMQCVSGIESDTCVAGIPGTEECNGLDDNCNGFTDEELTAPIADNQNGICAGSLKICEGTLGWKNPDYTTLILPGTYEDPEVSCEDGLDNDCDSFIDSLDEDCIIPQVE